MNDHVEGTHETPHRIAIALAVVALIGLAGVGFGWYDYNAFASQQASNAQTNIQEQESEQKIAALDRKLTDEDASNATVQSDLGVVTKRLRLTEGNSSRPGGKPRRPAKTISRQSRTSTLT
jgi:hypothetical protein